MSKLFAISILKTINRSLINRWRHSKWRLEISRHCLNSAAWHFLSKSPTASCTALHEDNS